MFSGRYEGVLSDTSPRGDFSFVARGAVRTAFGSNGRIPTERIFVHAKQIPDLRCLWDGLNVSFEIVESSRHQGKYEAAHVELICRLKGRIACVSAAADFAFVPHEDIRIAPEFEEMLRGLFLMDALPTENVFVHVNKLMGERIPLRGGMTILFFVQRCRTGKHAGRLEAMAVEICKD